MISALLTLVLAGDPAATTSAIEHCGDQGQAGMMACVDLEAHRARARLGRAERALVGALAAWDEDPARVAAARRAAVAARTAHASDRAAQCTFREALVGGGAGNSRRIARRACEADMDDAYAAWMETYVATRWGR